MKKYKALKWFAILIVVVFGINSLLNMNIKTTTHVIRDDRFSQQMDGFTIVQLSDVHSIRAERTGERIVNKVKQAEPNIIVITGDLIDFTYYNGMREKSIESGQESEIIDKRTVDFVAELMHVAQVYYVYGNHERTLLNELDNGKFLSSLVDEGVIMLNNVEASIMHGDQTINLIGIGDPAAVYNDERFTGLGIGERVMNAMLEEAASSIDPEVYTVLLSHRPEYYELYKKYPVDLVLTGHAHGGQIRIPFVGGLFAPNQGFFPKHTSGMFQDGRLHMIVNRGIGNSAFPLRVFNGPEIIKIELRGIE